LLSVLQDLGNPRLGLLATYSEGLSSVERRSDLEVWLYRLRTPWASLLVRMDDVWLFD
jgi:hypothetical protein